MTTTIQNWLLKRLLLPAGILPPGIKFSDLKYAKQIQEEIGNLGFEYFYTIDQDASLVNSSPIGGQIYAMHAPWPIFGPFQRMAEPWRSLGYKLFFGDTRLPREFTQMSQKSFEFAKKIGAKVVTIHTVFFDHKNLESNLAHLASLEEKFQIKAAIEHEGNYMYEGTYYDVSTFKKFDNSYDWIIDPVKMVSILDKIYPRHKFQICFDTAALINSKISIIKTVEKLFDRIGHVHLASNPENINDDLAWEIDRPDIAEVAKILYQKKYQGFITAEVAAYVGEHEARIANLYGILSVLRIPAFKKEVVGFTRNHQVNSVKYLLDHLS